MPTPAAQGLAADFKAFHQHFLDFLQTLIVKWMAIPTVIWDL